MSRRLRLPSLLLLLALAALASYGQKPEPIPPPVFLETGQATLVLEGRERAIPLAITEQGPLFGLAAVSEILGGELTTAGAGFSLKLGGSVFLVGFESPRVVIGQRIASLSQRPALVSQGLLVPLDFLTMSFGETLGYQLSWRANTHRLEVAPSAAHDVGLGFQLAHFEGISTLVLAFAGEAPHYRVISNPGLVEVRLQGGRFAPGTVAPEVDDPLVQSIEVDRDVVTIRLEPGVAAANYRLEAPPRLVFDFREPEAGAPAAPSGLAGEGDAAGPTRPAPRRGIRTIVIDPGHGGAETGAIGKGGSQEKDLTLLLARSLKAQLEQKLGVRVLLTRDDDSLVPLHERTALANENKADLFLSVHLNSSFGGRPQGAETYFLSLEASDELAARAAEAENPTTPAGADADPLNSLELILWDLAQSRYLAESQRLATLIQGELNAELGLKDRGVKQAPFVVLTGAAMPAVLIELGFLSNPEEETRLNQESYRAALVGSVVRAVDRYRRSLAGEPEPTAKQETGEAPSAPEPEKPPAGEGPPR